MPAQYGAAMPKTEAAIGGHVIVRGARRVMLDSSPLPKGAFLVIQFPSMQDLQGWWNSPAWRRNENQIPRRARHPFGGNPLTRVRGRLRSCQLSLATRSTPIPVNLFQRTQASENPSHACLSGSRMTADEVTFFHRVDGECTRCVRGMGEVQARAFRTITRHRHALCVTAPTD